MDIVKKFDELVESETSAKLLQNVNDIKWLYKECEKALNNNKTIITLDKMPTLELIIFIKTYEFEMERYSNFSNIQVNIILNRNSLMHLSNDYMKVKYYRGDTNGTMDKKSR